MGILDYVPPGFTLDPAQRDLLLAYERLPEGLGVVVLNMPVASGKTLTLDIIGRYEADQRPGGATMIAPTNQLINQSYDEIKAGGWNMAPYKNAARDVPWEVAKKQFMSEPLKMGNTMSYLANKAYGRTLLYDECFPGKQVIITDRGPSAICAVFEKWAHKENVKVLSFNEVSRKYEFKRVTHGWKRPSYKRKVTIKTHNGTFYCTENHPLLTTWGWKPAISLTPGDCLVGEGGKSVRVPSSDLKQLVFGAYLGDGHWQQCKEFHGRIRFCQGVAQKEYLEWKAAAVGGKVSLAKSGYGQSPVYVATSLQYKVEVSLRHILENISPLGLAVWYMDDGTLARGPSGNPTHIILHTNSFSQEECELMAEGLERRFGVHVEIKTTNRGFKHLYLKKEEALKFLEIVTPFSHPNLSQKFVAPAASAPSLDISSTPCFVVEAVMVGEEFDEPAYDLEVEDNHNFVCAFNAQDKAGRFIAHNCHTARGFLQDFEGVKLWHHLTPWPLDVRTVDQFLYWLHTDPEAAEHKKLARLLSRDPTSFILEQGVEEYRGREQLCLRVVPLTPKNNRPILWPPSRVKRIVMASATFSQEDLVDIGLDKRWTAWLSMPSRIPAARRPLVYDPVASPTYGRTGELVKLADGIRALAEWHKGERGLIHVTYALSAQLRPLLGKDKRFIFHSQDSKKRAFQAWQQSPDGVLLAAGMHEGVNLKYDMCRWQAIAKIAWPSLAVQAVRMKAELRPEWYLWEALKIAMQAYGRVCRMPDDYGVTYVLTHEFKRLYTESLKAGLVPSWFKEVVDI